MVDSGIIDTGRFAKRTRGRIGRGAIVGAEVVLPDGTEHGVSVRFEDGRIDGIGEESVGAGAEIIDAGGMLLMPGIVDLHSDALEKFIEPRPGAVFPLDMAIWEFDKTAAAAGITTMYHCVAFSGSGSAALSLRTNESAQRILEEINRLSNSLSVRSMIHVRYDILNAKARPGLEMLLMDGRIDMFSLMDHTPGQGQFRDLEAYRVKMIDGYGRTPSVVDGYINSSLLARTSVDMDRIRELAQTCVRMGVPIASHDDDSREKVMWADSLSGSISEFPINMEAVQEAAARGMYIAMGAPNVVRGASQSGNIAAKDVIAAGYGDILCSDYAPMSLLHSAFSMREHGLLPFHEVTRMVSLNPARAAGLDAETGSIEEGKRADLILVDLNTPVPSVVRTFVGGSEVYSARSKER